MNIPQKSREFVEADKAKPSRAKENERVRCAFACKLNSSSLDMSDVTVALRARRLRLRLKYRAGEVPINQTRLPVQT
jgi:hypothetical protein